MLYWCTVIITVNYQIMGVIIMGFYIIKIKDLNLTLNLCFWMFIIRLKSPHIISICHGTAPASELHQCFRRFLWRFPCLLSTLGPLTLTVSSRLRCVLHCPGITWWLLSSRSMRMFCWRGYLIRMRLCKHMHVVTMSLTVAGAWVMVVRSTWNLLARMPKAFSTTRRALDSL